MSESSTGDLAMNDALVRTLLAKCIVEATKTLSEGDSDIASAAQLLRAEMSNSDPQIAMNALLGISRVATSDDVQAILNLGLRRSLLASAAITSLSFICIPDARHAIETLQSSYAGTSLGQSIKALLDSQRSGGGFAVCSQQVTSAVEGTTKMPTNMGRSQTENVLSASDILYDLNSADPHSVIPRLLDLHCSSENLDSIQVVRRVWAERDADVASATIRNDLVQAIMARCLLEAERHESDARNDVHAAEALLRNALESADAMTVVVAMAGLVARSNYDDLISIARVPIRFPNLRNVVVRDLSVACGPGADAALSLMREAATSSERTTIDRIYEQFASDRARLCGVER